MRQIFLAWAGRGKESCHKPHYSISMFIQSNLVRWMTFWEFCFLSTQFYVVFPFFFDEILRYFFLYLFFFCSFSSSFFIKSRISCNSTYNNFYYINLSAFKKFLICFLSIKICQCWRPKFTSSWSSLLNPFIARNSSATKSTRDL